MTFASASGGDSVIDVLGPDGTTVLQSDDEHGTIGANSPSVSGLGIPTTGTYYIRVKYSGATPLSELLPYDLYFNIESGTPTPETEPNSPGAPQALPVGGLCLRRAVRWNRRGRVQPVARRRRHGLRLPGPRPGARRRRTRAAAPPVGPVPTRRRRRSPSVEV